MFGEIITDRVDELAVGRMRILRATRNTGRVAVNGMQRAIDNFHELFGQPRYDVLLGVANISEVSECMSRWGFLRELNNRMSEESDALSGSLVTYVDIKNFKAPNDRYGQSVGDLLLTITGWGLREIFRDPDQPNQEAMVGRWGGDEFISIQPAGAKMNQALFGGSLEFFDLDGKSGEATWHFDRYVEYLHRQDLHHDSEIYDAIKHVDNLGIDHLTYKFTFDAMDLSQYDEASEAIDIFAATNTIKATHLRQPTS